MNMLAESPIKIKQEDVGNRYKDSKVPMATFIEDYINGRVNVEGDMLQFFKRRDQYLNYMPTWDHLQFLVSNFLPEVLIHSQEQDIRIGQEHYDRGKDFFGAFLGESMIYTSGKFDSIDQSLEKAQENKMNEVCNNLQIKEGEKYLDIGCGWGTLIAHAAKHYGANATGVTVAKEGAAFARQRSKDYGVEDKVRLLNIDYRDIPEETYDKISCLEMAEHVGVKNFQPFMQQIYDLLDDDGLFYLQIAGLRRGFVLEDLNWGLFMNKYIFPGADASTPVSWVIEQLEKVNFEVSKMENVGIHYSHTIHNWYKNWLANKEFVLSKYGTWWFRLFEIFLAWSTIIAAQGSSTCWMITAHKNLNNFDRNIYIGENK